MDVKGLVDQKMIEGDRCLCSFLGSVVLEDGNSTRVVALIEGPREHALFLYQLGQIPTSKPADLHLPNNAAIPINSNFKFTIEQPLAAQGAGAIPVRIVSEAGGFVLEIPQGDETANFLTELKRACEAQSQVKGLPPSFAWLDKYLNPFLNDIFDPLKQQENNTVDDLGTSSTVADEPESGLSRSTFYQTASYKKVMRSYEKGLDDIDSTKDGKVVGRDNQIRLILSSRESEFTDHKTIRIFCGTWNVNGQPASESLEAWLACDTEPPDIYAVGFQELDLSKNAYIFSDSVREGEWHKRVWEGLHKGASYQQVRLVRLVGMMLIVFIRKELAAHVYEVDSDMVGTGILGMMGNKGGVGVRFDLHNTKLCFVNSHLAAHVEEYEHRNQDFRNINSRMIFDGRSPTISDNDQVYWIGDLNYRLSDVENDMVKNLISTDSMQVLMDYDQLNRQMALRKVFEGYVEDKITFKPTYKYDTGTDNWDTSEKCRTPAWCDRVLWRGHSKDIEQIAYRSHPKLKLSDHKPVSALFNAQIKKTDPVKYRRVYEDTMKELDRRENDFLPQVQLDITDVQFDDVKFMEPQTASIIVTNVGQVPVQFKFINKLNEPSYCKPWLIAKPSKHIINVGESYEIMVSVEVDKLTAPTLNTGSDRLEDILVLHLVGGKDLFVSVNGNYIPSSFGCSIEALVRLFCPISEVSEAKLQELEKEVTNDTLSPSPDRPLDVPKELWYMVDHLYRNGMKTEDLFQLSGLSNEIRTIRDAIDTGRPELISGTIHSVAEAILMFLESVREPVIPYSLYSRCLDCCSNYTLCKQVIALLSASHRNVFKYICAFLRKLLEYRASNNLDVKTLASLFGGVFLRTPLEQRSSPKSQQQVEERKKTAFVYHFLTNEYDE